MASSDDERELATGETLVQHTPTGQTGVPGSAVSPTSSVVPELIAGRYQILGLIGRGGMGAVYRARDSELDEVVALKVLSNELGTSPDSIERFKREVKLARRVTHPNVARTFDIGEHAGTRFLTMEFIDGESLSDVVRKKGRLPLGRVLSLAADICGGLSAAHKAGVVHRDLKPDNVMVASDGRVVITDFGIAREPIGAADAKHTIGGIVGTPAYMAPEQVEARPDIDARADIFAFGVMLFELMTGELPYKGESVLALAAARLYTDAPDPQKLRPDLPSGVCQVVLRCLSRDVAARYSDASEVATALANSSPTLPQGSSPRSVAAPPSGIHPVVSQEKTVAVLPFRNVGGAEDDYVADGLSSELIDTLSMTPGLRVRPQGAVAQFKGANRDPREIGRELQVDVIAEGSVRRAGDRVRLTVRLTSVEDGFQLWAQRFDRPANDLLVISDETAHAIASALTVSAVDAQHAPLDPVAVDLYLRARTEGRQMGAGRVHKAIELFRAAHERAPNDVKILAGLARACARAWFFQGTAPPDAEETARTLAKRASEAAPDDPEVLLALATVHLMDQNLKAAAEAARRAVTLSPWNPDALEFLGRLLSEAGRPDLALQKLETALQLDPTLRVARLECVRIHALLGNYSKALELLDNPVGVPDHEGDSVARARIALWSPEILASVLTLEVPPGDHARSPWRLVHLQQSVARGESQDAMIEEMGELAEQSRAASRFATLLYQILTELLVHLGRLDEALVCFEKAVQSGLIDLSWIDGKTPVARLATHPRFRELREPVAERGRVIREALGV